MSSKYPEALDSLSTSNVNATKSSNTHPALHNDVNDAVNKIEKELGTNPSGEQADVAARLDDHEDAIAIGLGAIPESIAVEDEPNVFSEANRFNSAEAITPEVGGETIPAGSQAFALETNGAVRVGASPLGDAYIKRNMAPGFDPNSNRWIAPTIDLLQIGDPPELTLGRRYGEYPDKPATVVLTKQFVAGTDEVMEVAWPDWYVTECAEIGLIAEDNPSLLPAPTIGFGTSGLICAEDPAGGAQVANITLTGKAEKTLSVSKVIPEQEGSLTFAVGTVITQLLDVGSTIGIRYPQAWVGHGGFQPRLGNEGYQATEVPRRLAAGGYAFGSRYTLGTGTLSEGKPSLRRDALQITDDQKMVLLGGHAPDSTYAVGKLTVGGPICQAVNKEQDPASGTVEVDSTHGMPTTGTIYVSDGTNVFSSTERTINAFKGTAVVSGGKIAKLASLRLAIRQQYVNVASRGGQVAANYGQGAAQTKIGNTGPTAASPEGGLLIGEGSGEVWIGRVESAVGGTYQKFASLQAGSGACFATRDSAAPTVDRWTIGRSGIQKWFTSSGVEQASCGEILGSGTAGIKTTGRWLFAGELQLEGDLNHDGSKVGFYGKAPVAQAAAITDPEETLASVIAKFKSLRDAVKGVGITA